MALGRRGSRRIVVDGTAYRWRLRRSPTYFQGLPFHLDLSMRLHALALNKANTTWAWEQRSQRLRQGADLGDWGSGSRRQRASGSDAVKRSKPAWKAVPCGSVAL